MNNISNLYSNYRNKWDDLYDSEKTIFNNLKISPHSHLLDIGAGCGGLGVCLQAKFGLQFYHAIEMDRRAYEEILALNPGAKSYLGCFNDIYEELKSTEEYDFVISLGALDWNNDCAGLIKKAWHLVKPGGKLILSVRLTLQPGAYDSGLSFQKIMDLGVEAIYPYIVFNAKDFGLLIKSINPASVAAKGYYGPPSESAHTIFKEICFSCFSIEKRSETKNIEKIEDIDLPELVKLCIESTL